MSTFPVPGANWSYLHTLTLKATTGVNGFALVNGTPNIISWVVPNDGKLHRMMIFSTLQVTSTETGGVVNYSYNTPAGLAVNEQLAAGGVATGLNTTFSYTVIVQPGSTVIISQGTALTGGAATLWAEIWGL